MDIAAVGEQVVRVTLSGRLDTQGVDRIETQFKTALVTDGRSAVVDLSRVEFVASMGIRMLISAAQHLRKRKAMLAVFGAPTLVMKVFEAVSLQKILPICATESEALEAVRAASL